MSAVLPAPRNDPAALFEARWAIRDAYTRIRRLRQIDPSIRDVLTRLDEMCSELTTELESIEPEMELRAVRVIPIREGAESDV